MRSTVAGDASSPAAITAGSPGIAWTIEKTSSEIASSTGATRATARPMRLASPRIRRARVRSTAARSKVTTPSGSGRRPVTARRDATLKSVSNSHTAPGSSR